MAFEYLTPEEAANFTSEQAEWEEAALKREAEFDEEMTKRLAETKVRMDRLSACLEARRERLWALADRLAVDTPRPKLVLVETETSDDA